MISPLPPSPTRTIRIISGPSAGAAHDVPGLQILVAQPNLKIEASGDVREIRNDSGARVFVVGDPAGVWRAGQGASPASATLQELLPLAERRDADDMEGRAVLVAVGRDGSCWIGADKFAQRDVYLAQSSSGSACVATDIRLLPGSMRSSTHDEVAVAHSLCTYGWRPAKNQTLFGEVARLGVGQSITLTQGAARVKQRPFVPVQTGDYDEADLGRYSDLLLDAIARRLSPDGNVVYLSSGWDSTAILACLVHLTGAAKVRCVIGRMLYSHHRGVVNQFEIDRARAVADFYGVPLDVVDFDYRDDCADLIERARALFAGHHLASVTGVNHLILADYVARTTNGGEAVFCGELSDGAHNLGFSQSATIFHPVLAFREYADKMASYLFGPTFLGLIEEGRHAGDPVFDMLKRRLTGQFEEPREPGQRGLQLLSTFFLRSRRFPFWSLNNSALMSDRGREVYAAFMGSHYLKAPAAAIQSSTLYSCYLHLYNSFHWQGSTVATMPLTAESVGLKPALPFWDGPLLDFLSAMPESWGRGLDLNPTKYPLKWMLGHRVRYPMHLQVGPHSYLYDVDPTFSHSAELLYRSGFSRHFKEALARREHEAFCASELLNHDYIRDLVGRYVSGEEVAGPGMADLMALCMLNMTRWHI